MADAKTSALPNAVALTGPEQIPGVQSAANVKITPAQLKTFSNDNPTVSGAQTVTGGTVTASAPLESLTQTWNNAAVTFTGWLLNITNTASAAASLLWDLQVGGASLVNVRRDGRLQATALYVSGTYGGDGNWWSANSANIISTSPLNFGTDVIVRRDAAGAFAQRNGTNAQSFRVYNTYTDASNYERAGMGWQTTTNVFTIGTTAAGTGTVRPVTAVGVWSFASPPVTPSYAVASLPAAPGTGARAMATDASATTTAGIGAVVAGGGANIVPVHYDGTNWRIG